MGVGRGRGGGGFAELQPPPTNAAAPCNGPEPPSSAVEVRAEVGGAPAPGPAVLGGGGQERPQGLGPVRRGFLFLRAQLLVAAR